MANEIRHRQNFLGGLIDDNPLASTAGVMNSAGLSALATITAATHAPIILDPDGVFGEPEIVYVTAHAEGATSADILRAQEGTLQRVHRRDTPWVHGPTSRDLNGDPWTSLTLNTPWVAYGTTVPGYYLSGDKRIYLRGMVASGTSATVIANLPTGYRPEQMHRQVSMGNFGAGDVFALIDISTIGNITLSAPLDVAATYVTLDGISFRQFA